MIDRYWRVKRPDTTGIVHSGTLSSPVKNVNRLGAFILLCHEMSLRDGVQMVLQIVYDDVTDTKMDRFVATVVFNREFTTCELPSFAQNENPKSDRRECAVQPRHVTELDAAFQYYRRNLSQTVRS